MSSTTTLRILNDITGTDQTVEVPRDRAELIISLMHTVGIFKHQEKIVRLCVHFQHSLITLHFWVEPYPATEAILDSFIGIPKRTVKMLQEARVGQ